MSWLNEAKITTAEDKLQQVRDANVEAAKKLRDDLIVSDIEVFGALWQVDDKGRDNMTRAINFLEVNNLPPETTQAWILSDNSIRMTTAAELTAVLSAYTLRMGDAFTAYATWRAGDQLIPFSV